MKIGDVVSTKEHGPLMTIHGILGDMAICRRFDDKDELITEEHDINILAVVIY